MVLSILIFQIMLRISVIGLEMRLLPQFSWMNSDILLFTDTALQESLAALQRARPGSMGRLIGNYSMNLMSKFHILPNFHI